MVLKWSLRVELRKVGRAVTFSLGSISLTNKNHHTIVYNSLSFFLFGKSTTSPHPQQKHMLIGSHRARHLNDYHLVPKLSAHDRLPWIASGARKMGVHRPCTNSSTWHRSDSNLNPVSLGTLDCYHLVSCALGPPPHHHWLVNQTPPRRMKKI